MNKSDYSFRNTTICGTFIIYKAGKDSAKKLQYADTTQFPQGRSTNPC